MTELTVWHDGSCPFCRREIALMRRLDWRGAIRFVDVATAGADACPLDRGELLARFHAREDIAPGVLRHAEGSSFCEWKGAAVYWDVVVDGAVLERAGWSYRSPTPSFAILRDHVAFYARPFDRCFVDGQIVTPQEGRFYGGWITDRFAGPFKGGPGSAGW